MASKTKGSKTRFKFLLEDRKMSKSGCFSLFEKPAHVITKLKLG